MKNKPLHKTLKYLILGIIAITTLPVLSGCTNKNKNNSTITNVSYDPTREFYEDYNEAFIKYYKDTNGKDINIIQSHGGSGSQARAVVEGCDADVVTLALERDISLIEKAGLIEPDWIKEFDQDSSPYTSTILFLVRKGNQKNIQDWNDLIKQNVEVITPDPKSSGGACWNFLAAWKYALQNNQNDEQAAKQFVKALYDNVSVMDSGARGATTTFVENKKGDVLIAWENEALVTIKEYPDEFEVVSPSISILAQPSVAIVDENVEKDGKREIETEYINYLYTEEAQNIIAENGYRPTNQEVLQQYKDKFNLNMKLCTIQDFGGWEKAYKKFFQDGGIFDDIYIS